MCGGGTEWKWTHPVIIIVTNNPWHCGVICLCIHRCGTLAHPSHRLHDDERNTQPGCDAAAIGHCNYAAADGTELRQLSKGLLLEMFLLCKYYVLLLCQRIGLMYHGVTSITYPIVQWCYIEYTHYMCYRFIILAGLAMSKCVVTGRTKHDRQWRGD